MSIAAELQLNEPIIEALTYLLENNLPANVTALNETITDDAPLDLPAQFVPFLPIAQTLQGGLPCIGIGDISGEFINDLQTSLEAEHQLALMVVLQTSDHGILAKQLRRYRSLVAYTIQQDRLQGRGGVMYNHGESKVMYTEFTGYLPGRLLGDHDPDDPGGPPVSFRSWTTLLVKCRRTEV